MRRLTALLGALILGSLGAAWYFGTGDEEAQLRPVSESAGLELRVAEPVVQVDQRSRKRFFTSGLQTTVPDTLGHNELTATYTLEDGGFRVRVLTHEVADARDHGVVVQQLPRGGVTRRVGWIVTIFVGKAR